MPINYTASSLIKNKKNTSLSVCRVNPVGNNKPTILRLGRWELLVTNSLVLPAFAFDHPRSYL